MILELMSALALSASAQEIPSLATEVETALRGSIRYLQANQREDGEWSSWMMNDHPLLLLGPKGKKAVDYNAFTTSAVHNSLARVALMRPEEKDAIQPLSKALQSLEGYRENDRYGFWKLYPRQFKNEVVMVRRPDEYLLVSNFIQAAANVPADADDTASVLTSKKLSEKLGLSTKEEKPIGSIFSEYRDRKRRSIHYYNVLNGMNIGTGAFMTWHAREKIFTPISWAPLNGKKAYIPYGANEVDCVVNSNVLGTLALYGELDQTEGVDRACRFVKKQIFKSRYGMCGVYYPNPFHFTYATAKAYADGASCLDEAMPSLTEFLLDQQDEDGSFHFQVKRQGWKGKILKLINALSRLEPKPKDEESQRKIREQNLEVDPSIDPQDRLQSTLYAVTALLYLSDANPALKEQTAAAIDAGMKYVISQLQWSDEQAHLKGGVFFAGGTLVRGDLLWRSEAYSTALAAEAFALYLKRSSNPVLFEKELN